MSAMIRKRTSPKLVVSHPEPPLPPDDLERQEREIWNTVCADFVGTNSSYRVLHSALKMHMQGRKAWEVVEKEGMTYENSHGATHAHPMVAASRQAMKTFTEMLKLLKLKL